MKIKEYLNDIKGEFHATHGAKYGFDQSQSEVHFDLTVDAATSYIQSMLMSGKLSEIQGLLTQGYEAIHNSPYYKELLQKCANNYYGLTWPAEKKEELAKDALQVILNGLKDRFDKGGYSRDAKGMMEFAGLDSGVLGMLGKVGGMFGKFFK